MMMAKGFVGTVVAVFVRIVIVPVVLLAVIMILMNKEFGDILEYNDHPALVYGARVSRMILDQVLACEGRLYPAGAERGQG